jgi:endonuclease/exonuclease/phosphatase family metal-dependent hydrolase
VSGPPDELTVATLNVWGRWADWPVRREALRTCFPARRPDVLLLQEVRHDDHGDQAAEIAALLGYEHHVTVEGHRNDDGGEGLALLGRHPLEGVHAETLPASEPARRSLVAQVACTRGPVTVVCGHTVAVPAEVRRIQVRALLGRREDGPVVLGADLNETPEAVAPALEETGWRDALDGDAAPTWPMNPRTFGTAWESVIGRAPEFSLERRRLDYLLSRGLDVLAAGVEELACDGGPHASDHALVWARYAISRP